MAILTERQEAFAQHFAAHRDGPSAYRHAFRVRKETTKGSVSAQASRLIGDAKVAARIEEIVSQATATLPATMTVAGALAAWLEIATADPDELIGLRVGCCRYCHGEGFGYQWKEREFLAALDEAERMRRRDPKADHPLPDIGGGFGFRMARPPRADCPECEGEGAERVVARDTSKLSKGARALFGGVKKSRHGLEVIIADRQKALENVTRMLGGFNDKVRLDGSLGQMLDWVREAPKDPQTAARMYRDMVAANAA